MKSVMMCRFGVLGIDFNPHNPMTNTHKRSPSPILESAAGGHIVSSALVACEPPTFLPSHEGFNNDVFPQREYVEDGIEVRVGVTSDLGTESVAGIILRMALEPILTSVSLLVAFRVPVDPLSLQLGMLRPGLDFDSQILTFHVLLAPLPRFR